MSAMRQIVAGILAGLVSLLIIIGGLTMALAEGATGIPLASPTATATLPLATVPPGEPTFTPSPLPRATATPTLTPECPIPPGWEPLTLTDDANLSLIAEARGISLQELLAGNCMTSDEFIPDTVLYAPPLIFTATVTETETVTATPTTPAPTSVPTTPPPPCTISPPLGWVIYVVKSGDTLFSISQAHGITVQLLQSVNCLFTTTIRPGDRLWVPFVPTQTPSASPSLTPTETLPPTTPPVTPTDTPTGTSTQTPTITPSPTPITPTPVPPSPTDTSLPPTDTATPVTPDPPTATPSPTPA